MTRRTAACLSLGLTVGLSTLALADEIVLIPNSTVKAAGGRIRGQISTETPAEVKIKPAVGADQLVPVDQIADVTYDGAPPSYALAETRENNGQLKDAADLYKKAATEAATKPYIAQSARFKRANILAEEALADPTKAASALEELDAFVKSAPNARQLGPALELIIRLSLQKGETAKADAALSQLSEKVTTASGRVGVLKARVQAKSGKPDLAIAGLDKILLTAPKGSAQAREAKLAKAEALVMQKKYDDALANVQEVIKEAPPEAADVQALAHNTLGDCYRAAGRRKDALLAYLKTDVLFDKDKEQHPRALAMIEQLFTEIKQDGRAAEVHERLKQLYPQSPWAKK